MIALGANVTEKTRGYSTSQATSGYTFSGGEYITVAVTGLGNSSPTAATSRSTSEEIKLYTVTAGSAGNNGLTYQKDDDGTSKTYQFDWLSSTETISLRAWSDGKTTSPSAAVDPDGQTFTVETTQTGSVKELLYSPSNKYGCATNNGTINIPLYHQLARIVINVKDEKDGAPTISEITIGYNAEGHKIPTTAEFSKPTTTNYGSWSNHADLSTVAPKLETTASTGYDYTYSAVVIPGTTTEYTAGLRLINITIGSKTYAYKITAGGITLQAGKQYNFNITIKETGLSVTTATVSAWSDGAESNTSSITATI